MRKFCEFSNITLGKVEHMGTYENLMKSGVDFTTIVKSRAEKLQKMKNTGSLIFRGFSDKPRKYWKSIEGKTRSRTTGTRAE